VFCRRSDGLTEQSFYAPKVHAMLLITGRKRPAPATTRELVSYKLAPGARITAADVKGIPKGWALAALDRPAPEQETSPLTAVAAAEAIPPISTDTAPNSQGGGIVAPTVPKIEGRPQPPPAATAPQHRPEGQIVADTPSIPAPPAVAPPVIAGPPSIAPPAPASPTADRVAPPAPTNAEPVPSIAAPTMEHPPTIAAGPIKAPPATSHPTVGHPPSTAAPSSGYGVQLASYSKSDSARTAWRTLQRQLKPLLDAVPFTIRRADLGPPKGVVHRVIAGPFPDRNQARALCRSIKARGGTCFVWGFNG
jgi:cell division septation protein DedD